MQLRWLDRAFLESVSELYVPSMGTDVLAPTLYSLLRYVRARTVLEGGMGFTTPFIARALADNAAVFREERDALRRKAGEYVRVIDALDDSARDGEPDPSIAGLPAVYAPKASRLAEERTRWLFSEPGALLRPGYYLEEREHRLVCVDSNVATSSSAPRVRAKLAELGLTSHVDEHVGDFWSYDFRTSARHALPFDVIWIDLPVSVRNVTSLLSGPHWRLLNPNGGLLLIHDMLSHEGGQMLVDEFIRADQRGDRFDDFETVGMLEPHRMVQNSFLMIRKRPCEPLERVERAFTAPKDAEIEREARLLVADAPEPAGEPPTPHARGGDPRYVSSAGSP